MKKLFTLFVSLSIVLCSLYTVSQQRFTPSDLGIIADFEKSGLYGTLQPRHVAAAPAFHVAHYLCDWTVDPAVRYIKGVVSPTFFMKEEGSDTVVFDLSDSLTVTSVSSVTSAVTWRHSGNRLVIRYPWQLGINLPQSLSISYEGVPADDGFGSFTLSNHNGTPILWTLSEPYGSADWWPCRNGLDDKADAVSIVLRTPQQYRGISNGRLFSETIENSQRIMRWHHIYPVATYLVCLSVTNYTQINQQVIFAGDTLDQPNYVYPEDSALIATQAPDVIGMVQLYDTLFGRYPFHGEKYGQIQFGWGGGMEHQTATFLGGFGFELMAHELAHMWFGDMVTCGSWADIWLNEGFATYLSGLCYEHLAPDYWIRFRQVRIQSIISRPDGSVYCTDTTDVNRIFSSRLSYAKGAMILHQLRILLGDSAFFAALNNYLHDPSIAYSFARTPQLIAHLEASSGQELSEYVNDWYTGEGYPSYTLNWEQSGDSVFVQVHQSQSHASVSFFELPIDLKLKNSLHDTIIRVLNTSQGQTWNFRIPFSADSLVFDPEWNIISGKNTVIGVGEKSAPAAFTIYPNPAGDRITVRALTNRRYDSFQVVSTEGKVVMSGRFRDQHYEITTTGLPAGGYILHLSDGKRNDTGAFVKQ